MMQRMKTNTVRFAIALAALIFSQLVSRPASAQLDPTWREPFPPFQIAENLYYVGTRGISSFLLVGDQGNVLIDTGLAEGVPLVRASIEKLGFKLADVKIMLASHAHFDHVAGHAAMQKLTGAVVMAIGDDAEALRTGKDRSALAGPGWAAVKVDRVLQDGSVVTLGNLTLTARHTPGHTPGCTTWVARFKVDGQERTAVFVGGTSINRGVKLVGNERHPQIADQYAQTFRVLRELPAELFLAQHPRMFAMEEKVQRRKPGAPSPFLDPTGYRAFVESQEKSFTTQLEQERAAAK
jgi:metallo-beta-lactamase class B